MQIRPEFHSDMAEMVLNDIQYQRSNYYYFVGKIDKWNGTDTLPVDTTDNSALADTVLRSNIAFVSKVRPSDVSMCCNYYGWESGTVFEKWDHTKNLTQSMFYCVTDEYKVYKCLDNSGGAPSTVKPTGNSVYPIRLVDGYLWKYMYTIPSFKRVKFSSLTDMPVQRAISESFYNKGAVQNAVVLNSGSGYTDVPQTTIQITGTTTGAGAVAHVGTVGALGQITSIVITNGGSGYTSSFDISVTSVNGSGAEFTTTTSAGAITAIVPVGGSTGLGYVPGDPLSITVGGAILVPVINSAGTIEDVIVVKSGAGYTSPPSLAAVGTIPMPGDGLYPENSSALLSSIISGGRIKRVLIADPGIGYPRDSSTTIVVQGDGIDAAFTPVVYDGKVIDVITENPGSGYTSIKLTVVGGGVGAVVDGVITQSDFASDQSIIEQTTVPGAIYAIEVQEPGNFYSDNTTIAVAGDGVGCIATPVIVSGQISKIVVTTPGSGYSYATIQITDPVSGAGASAYAILPPEGGHGKNAIKELYATSLSINASLKSDIVSSTLSQDFRQFGILKNPTNYYTGTTFSKQNEAVFYKLLLSNTTGMVVDEVLKFGDYRFIVAAINGNQVELQSLTTVNVSPLGTLVAEADPSRQYQALSILSSPELNKYSGSLLYVTNETGFTFNEDQGIILRTFIKF